MLSISASRSNAFPSCSKARIDIRVLMVSTRLDSVTVFPCEERMMMAAAGYQSDQELHLLSCYERVLVIVSDVDVDDMYWLFQQRASNHQIYSSLS